MELSISEKVKAIVEDPTQEFPITGRELFNSLGFERRTSGNCWAVLRVAVLEEASKVPVYVSNSAPLVEATTLMRMNDYSQLPVTNNKLRGLCGFISWRTIGEAMANGVKSDMVKDYIQPIERTLKLDTPLSDNTETPANKA